MTEENKVQALPHNLIMENRNRLTVSGVSDVDSFDEQTVVIFTQMGELTVRGSDLHIINLNVDSGELSLEGTVNSLTYSDEQPGKGGGDSRGIGQQHRQHRQQWRHDDDAHPPIGGDHQQDQG